jgi:X-X-X-Leu-X-X-Gly heptad repeat protein
MVREVQQVLEVQVGGGRASGVRASGVRASGGRHATNERYRGRHRKPRAQGRRRGVIRLGVTAAVAALLVCLPQPSWADRSGNHATRSAGAGQVSAGAGQVSAGAGQVTVRSLPDPFRQRHQ